MTPELEAAEMGASVEHVAVERMRRHDFNVDDHLTEVM